MGKKCHHLACASSRDSHGIWSVFFISASHEVVQVCMMTLLCWPLLFCKGQYTSGWVFTFVPLETRGSLLIGIWGRPLCMVCPCFSLCLHDELGVHSSQWLHCEHVPSSQLQHWQIASHLESYLHWVWSFGWKQGCICSSAKMGHIQSTHWCQSLFWTLPLRASLSSLSGLASLSHAVSDWLAVLCTRMHCLIHYCHFSFNHVFTLQLFILLLSFHFKHPLHHSNPDPPMLI